MDYLINGNVGITTEGVRWSCGIVCNIRCDRVIRNHTTPTSPNDTRDSGRRLDLAGRPPLVPTEEITSY